MHGDTSCIEFYDLCKSCSSKLLLKQRMIFNVDDFDSLIVLRTDFKFEWILIIDERYFSRKHDKRSI